MATREREGLAVIEESAQPWGAESGSTSFATLGATSSKE